MTVADYGLSSIGRVFSLHRSADDARLHVDPRELKRQVGLKFLAGEKEAHRVDARGCQGRRRLCYRINIFQSAI